MKFCASSHFVLSSLRMIVFMNITPTRIASAPLHKFEHHIGQKYLTYLRKRGQCLYSVHAVYTRCTGVVAMITLLQFKLKVMIS